MTVIDVRHDFDTLTLVIESEFAAPPERIWQLWEDPRQLERWWGPPMWPATFEKHDLTLGGQVTYYMTGPDSERASGWWRITAVEPPIHLEFEDGFADDDGNAVDDMPVVRTRVDITETDTGTRMTVTSSFNSAEELQQLLDMGMLEGARSAAEQIDALLAEDG